MLSKKLKGFCAILARRGSLTISLYTMRGHMVPAALPAHVQLLVQKEAVVGPSCPPPHEVAYV